MTENEYRRVKNLRENGNSYNRIAEITGLTPSAIKMHCSRNNIVPCNTGDFCLYCGKKLEKKGKGRPILFCSDICRVYSWREKNKAAQTHRYVCACCGKEFNSYVPDRKFCSHDCYIKLRFGGAKAV